jgi:hypothetical protein
MITIDRRHVLSLLAASLLPGARAPTMIFRSPSYPVM